MLAANAFVLSIAWFAHIANRVVVSVEGRSVPVSPDVSLLPLCVDLDGTLVRTDTLLENLLAILVTPRVWQHLPRLMAGTLASFKQRAAAMADINAALLPYNADLRAYLVQQKAEGRRLVLATAANLRLAEAVATEMGFFDEVFASDGVRDLTAPAKAAVLAARFPGGFVYAGTRSADLAVWAKARAAIIVNGSTGLRAAVRAIVPIEADISPPRHRVTTALRAMRPYQWVKNLLVFVPILTSGAARSLASWSGGALAFVAFCLVASSIYLLNDLADLSADRQHPRKRNRPLASGALALGDGFALALVLATAGLLTASLAGIFTIVAVYAAMSVGYSVRFKQMALVDVFLLTGLYTARLAAGGIATGHPITVWLFNVSTFLFLSLALLKRVGELTAVARSPGMTLARRGYQPGDTAVLQMFGCASAFVSSAMLALFVDAETTVASYAAPFFLWGAVPLLLFWQCRLWLATTRGHMLDDPIVYATRDWVSWVVGIVLVLLLLAAKFGLSA